MIFSSRAILVGVPQLQSLVAESLPTGCQVVPLLPCVLGLHRELHKMSVSAAGACAVLSDGWRQSAVMSRCQEAYATFNSVRMPFFSLSTPSKGQKRRPHWATVECEPDLFFLLHLISKDFSFLVKCLWNADSDS